MLELGLQLAASEGVCCTVRYQVGLGGLGGGQPEFVNLKVKVEGQVIDLSLGTHGLFGSAGGIDQQELVTAFKNAKRYG